MAQGLNKWPNEYQMNIKGASDCLYVVTLIYNHSKRSFYVMAAKQRFVLYLNQDLLIGLQVQLKMLLCEPGYKPSVQPSENISKVH